VLGKDYPLPYLKAEMQVESAVHEWHVRHESFILRVILNAGMEMIGGNVFIQ
jgi:hypothetical protein